MHHDQRLAISAYCCPSVFRGHDIGTIGHTEVETLRSACGLTTFTLTSDSGSTMSPPARAGISTSSIGLTETKTSLSPEGSRERSTGSLFPALFSVLSGNEEVSSPAGAPGV